MASKDWFPRLRGTMFAILQIGKGGPNLKANGAALEARNNADSAFVVARALQPAGDNDLTDRQTFYTSTPNDPYTYTYENISLYDAQGSPQAANEIQYVRVWLPAGRVITKMRTYIQSGANGARQIQAGIYRQAVPTAITGPAATTIAAGSNGVSLPTGTINVASTTGFPSSGTIFVTTGAGTQTVAYTGVSGGNQFTGCTGGTGAMATGGAVSTLVLDKSTAANTVPNATTLYYDVSLSASYTVPSSGFYWLAFQVDNGTMAFLISATFRADSVKRREETPVTFALPTLAGATTSPQSAVLLVMAVE